MEAIGREFDRLFGKWGISLPKGSMERREGGVLGDNNHAIFYAFGNDERGEHLNVYTEHRFAWGHYHLRIYENGDVLHLPAERDILMSSPGDSPEEKTRKEAERREHNSMVYEMLETEGIMEVKKGRLKNILESN